jgi:hypothetical protein
MLLCEVPVTHMLVRVLVFDPVVPLVACVVKEPVPVVVPVVTLPCPLPEPGGQWPVCPGTQLAFWFGGMLPPVFPEESDPVEVVLPVPVEMLLCEVPVTLMLVRVLVFDPVDIV